MKHLSIDLRQRIVELRKKKTKISDIAQQLLVSKSSVVRCLRWNKAGSLEPKHRSGRRKMFLESHYEIMRIQVEEHSDMTLKEHAALFAKTTGICVSFKTVDRIFTRLGITQKKDGTRHRALE